MSEHTEECAIHGCEGWNGPRHCDCKPAPSAESERCRDCEEAAKHAYSDATTPGFFYAKCEKHRGHSALESGKEGETQDDMLAKEVAWLKAHPEQKRSGPAQEGTGTINAMAQSLTPSPAQGAEEEHAQALASSLTESFVIEIARELYDRFVYGGWEPQDAHLQIREILSRHAAHVTAAKDKEATIGRAAIDMEQKKQIVRSWMTEEGKNGNLVEAGWCPEYAAYTESVSRFIELVSAALTPTPDGGKS